MQLALLQYDPRFGEVGANLDRTGEILAAAETRPDVWVLPELFQTGYDFASEKEVADLAEEMEGPTLERVQKWAAEQDCAIAYGFAERAGDRFYNSAAIVDADRVWSHYRKLHLFDREKEWFSPGDRPLEVVELAGARVGLMVCFDWRFPETARTLAFRGADLIVHPSNLVLPWCPDAMITRALENNVFVATADRWGVEERAGRRLRFIGSSQVVSPRGTRLGQLGEEEDGVLIVEIDPEQARNKQVGEHNHLWEDRRTEFYEGGPVS